jgi:hypothetical protein
MGLPVEVNNLMMGSLGGYTIGRSLRFRNSASAYLSRTPASNGNQQKWTVSFWYKPGRFGSQQPILASYSSTTNYAVIGLSLNAFYNSSDTLKFLVVSANSAQATFETTAVFRDPSAWYHVVIAVDTTQATSTNRVGIYVNGVQVTSFITATYPAQNTNLVYINTTNPQQIGAFATGTYGYYDGYMAEFNFVDGQQLTPSSFGAYDTNGVWQPKKYTGTYGTNGFYLPFSGPTTNGFSSYYASFNGSNQYLSMADNAAFDLAASDFTLEAWVNPSSSGGATARNVMNQSNSGAGSNSSFYFGAGNDGIALYLSTSGTSWTNYAQTSVPIGVGQWSHVVWQRRGNTLEIYLNGVLQTVTSGSSSFSGTVFNSSRNVEIGTQNAAACWFHGSISNLRFVKGSAVYTANFTPPASATTTVTNTQLLTLQNATFVDNSANAFSITNNNGVTSTSGTVGNYWTIANDQSGNNNHWVTNNISLTSGTTYDSMIDSPTVSASASNYCVGNPLNPDGSTWSNGNLAFSVPNSTNNSQATFAVSSGKWYWETIFTAAHELGVQQTGLTARRTNAVTYNKDGTKYVNGTNSAYGATYTNGDVIGTALDMTGGTVTFYKNNVSQGSISLSGVGITNGTMTISAGGALTQTGTVNFGQQSFTYTPPTGFNALNTYNLPTPTIANGAQYMAATTYTGNGSTQTITNGGNNTIGTTFQPDFVWIKSRSDAVGNRLLNSITGVYNYLISNSTLAESTDTTSLTAFNSNGFSLGAAAANGFNTNGSTYIGWQWQANKGTNVTNTNGSITSTVSANTTAGFSVVTYTGTGANATVGHGLGVIPNMIIAKVRSTSGADWTVYHSSLGATQGLFLDTTAAATTNANFWNNTAPTSSVYSVGSSGGTNNSGNTMIAYCWAAVAGYSAFGSYTGNGSTDGPFIFTNFRPRWVMFKRSDGTGYWLIKDSSRNGYNQTDPLLYANASDAEYSAAGAIDILSNGFKLRATSLESNASGGTYVWAAFSENPFKYSRGR